MDSRVLDINAAYLGVPTETLMENAGKAVADECMRYRSVCIFAGRGNNGGDGLVAARILFQNGANIKLYALAGERSRLCRLNFERLPEKLDVAEIKSVEDVGPLDGFELIVDALLGTGFTGVLREPSKSIVAKINGSPALKLSVDTPTAGMVEADMVLSLHESKVIGAKVADIGIPEEAELYCGPGDVVCAIPARKKDSHKGEFGKLLVIGGAKQYIGTPTLVGQAAQRVGTDLVTLAVPQYVADKMPFDPNIMVTPLESKDFVTAESLDVLDASLFDTIVVGNGMGRAKESKEALKKILSWKKPTVIDADALNLLEFDWLHGQAILTPHKKEFEGLFGKAEGNLEKISEIAAKNASKINSTIVLKGEVDVISNGTTTRLNKSGTPFMTKGGTGDVLAGVIGGLLAQNKLCLESACAGAFLTGLAGEIASDKLGESLTATDVIASLHEAIEKCRSFAK
ncbi:MAG TPA: NAD(P)H-hydrate dehydratase [Candidatus Altiarchaeales archaeon]|nr:NAD(P)H-hydrate dehydratase [Candidatus Altiarchaeales archaeon]